MIKGPWALATCVTFSGDQTMLKKAKFWLVPEKLQFILCYVGLHRDLGNINVTTTTTTTTNNNNNNNNNNNLYFAFHNAAI